ncbi:ionotropic receptor 75a-like [Rhynchophorus ferrugineus]|uniref:ionotropic receptor 75a-like n=1 Tax=Rhynchophorus ferrugineus TaxID=354439 RepID=UPI003FCD5FFE
MKSDENITVNTFNRFHSRLMFFCRRYYNFSLNVSSTKSWGYTQPNGHVDGIVGGLLRKEIDIGMSPIFVKQERLSLLSYGRKTWNLRAAFILRNPKSRKSYQIFLKPLSSGVWIGIVLLSLASIIAQLLIRGVVKSPRFPGSNADMTSSYIILRTLGSLCQQGMGSCSNLLSGRIVVIFTLLLGSMVYQFYSASLVSFLLNVPTTIITNMQGILDQGFGVGCQDTLYDRLYLARSSNNVTKEIYRRILKKTDNKTAFLQSEEGMELVKRGQYAFHIGLEMAYPIIQNTFDEHTICELREVPMWGKRHVHAAYQKNSPFKDAMDVCLARLSENGVLNREYIFWHPKKPHCLLSGTAITINTGLNDFYPALAVLFIGMLLSLQILIMEHVWYNKTHAIIKPYCE